jgi:PKHD-type hydroxylase
MKQKRIITEDFFIGNLGDIEASNEILNAYMQGVGSNIDSITKYDKEASVGNYEYNEKVRKCHISWLDVTKTTFVEVGLRKIIENVNAMIWNYDLDHEWQSGIQFTKYNGKGEHYNWHKDYYEELKGSVITLRKLSVVYCLSKKSDYTGGEFQIRTSKGGVYTTKFDYGDFIVFPSNKLHRVKPLKDGNRITMVGWYR